MSGTRVWPRVAAACGLLYPVLLIVGDDVVAKGDQMADAASGEELVRIAAEKNVAAFFIGRSVGLISLLCLFVFAAYVASQLRRYRGEHDPLPYVALGAGAMAAVLAMTSAIAQFALVRHAADGMDPVLAQTLLSLGGGFGMAWLPLAVLLAAIAAEGVRGTIVARGIAWVGAALAVGLAVGYVLTESGLVVPAGYFAIMLTWLWFIAASISFIRRARTDAAADHPVTQSSSGVSLR